MGTAETTAFGHADGHTVSVQGDIHADGVGTGSGGSVSLMTVLPNLPLRAARAAATVSAV